MYDELIWTEEYSVGIEIIDNQHKEFFNLCNNLLELSEGKVEFTQGESVLAINRLGDYAKYHLGTEEEYFEKYNVPHMEDHIKSHDHFRVKSAELISKVSNRNYDLKDTLKESGLFAGNWLFEHILSMDKKYSMFFNEHGLK